MGTEDKRNAADLLQSWMCVRQLWVLVVHLLGHTSRGEKHSTHGACSPSGKCRFCSWRQQASNEEGAHDLGGSQAAMQPLCNGAVRDRGKGGDGRRCTELFGCALKLDADPQPVCKMFPLTRFSALHYCCCFEGPFKTHGIISESELEEIQTEWCLSCYEDGERN